MCFVCFTYKKKRIIQGKPKTQKSINFHDEVKIHFGQESQCTFVQIVD